MFCSARLRTKNDKKQPAHTTGMADSVSAADAAVATVGSSSYTSAVMTTLVFTGIFIFLIVQSDTTAIMANWDKRRCEFPVMLSGALYKPADDGRTGMEFAKDNFSFCTSKLIDSVLKTAFAPFYAIAGQQISAQGAMTGPMNSIRSMLANAKKTFEKFMNMQFLKYNIITRMAQKSMLHLQFAMKRVSAIVYSIVYMGLSIMTTSLNTMDFITNVIRIFLIIIISMIIFTFFLVLPFLPLILLTIIAIGQWGVNTDGLAAPFCVDPEAQVILEDNTTKPLKEIRLGDRLQCYKGAATPNIVEGILTAGAADHAIYEIRGVRMSGSHRVYLNGKAVLAKEHPEAKLLADKIDRLICLNTSQHAVPFICAQAGEPLWVSDWEEVSTEADRHKWIDIVHMHLNGSNTSKGTYPTAPPLVCPETLCYKEGGSLVPISELQIGDRIATSGGEYTEVLGTYEGQIYVDKKPAPEWCSDGVWKKSTGDFWTTEHGVQHIADGRKCLTGRFLITAAETFYIMRGGKQVLVRDFTEVGASHIDETYEHLDFLLNGLQKK